MLTGFSNTDKITLYGIFGGIPDYIARINKNLSVQQNAENLFFNPAGRLFEEPSNLLKQELKAPQSYNSIINAIASGAGRVHEIASKAGIETSQCSNMLSVLISLGIVKKEFPVGEKEGMPSKKTFYRLSDYMFRFWYRFVRPDLSRILMGHGKTVCTEVFDKSDGRIETFMGQVFEECSIQYLWNTTGSSKSSYKVIGRWWGPNLKEKREEEIDILAHDGKGNALLGECKWRTTRTGIDILEELLRKSGILPGFSTKQYALFSRSGFTAELKRTAEQRKDIMLISPADMF
jgi:AAA+ ATPase superfamily predicted ATPase